jgi:hypothetical protein
MAAVRRDLPGGCAQGRGICPSEVDVVCRKWLLAVPQGWPGLGGSGTRVACDDSCVKELLAFLGPETSVGSA